MSQCELLRRNYGNRLYLYINIDLLCGRISKKNKRRYFAFYISKLFDNFSFFQDFFNQQVYTLLEDENFIEEVISNVEEKIKTKF